MRSRPAEAHSSAGQGIGAAFTAPFQLSVVGRSPGLTVGGLLTWFLLVPLGVSIAGAIPARTRELCLKFANTLHWHASDHPLETLHSYGDLLTWMIDAQTVSPEEAEDLLRLAQAQPIVAAAVFQRGITLREARYRLVVAHVNAEVPAAEDLLYINHELSSALAHQQISVVGQSFVWIWNTNTPTLNRVLWPLVRSAADLLTSPEVLARVGQCADDRGCGWFFLDTSKNHSRRWCDINDCGNRAKQRRHYQRTRQSRAAQQDS